MSKKKLGSSFGFKKLFALLLCCVLLTGCAGRTEDSVSGTSPTTMPTGASLADTQTVTSPEEASRLMIDRNQIFDIDVDDEYKKEKGRIAGHA